MEEITTLCQMIKAKRLGKKRTVKKSDDDILAELGKNWDSLPNKKLTKLN